MDHLGTNGVFRVALTGGPSGGKTTGQSLVSDALENQGFKVFRVPEAATVLLSSGISFASMEPQVVRQFQLNLLKTLLQLENTVYEVASSLHGPRVVMLCDRGAMDPSAYIDRGGWLEILRELKLDEVEIRDNRYDLVLHFVTAADGAEAFYTLENNATRRETPEQARELDRKVQTAWLGHPYVTVLDNSSDFQEKCTRAVGAVLARMGIADRIGKNVTKRKFLLRAFPEEIPEYRDFRVEHTYIRATQANVEIRIRARFDAKGCTCSRNVTIRRPQKAGQIVEERRALSQREYDALLLQSDETRHRVFKLRRCFFFNNNAMHVDRYEEPCGGLVLLEAYLPESGHREHLPGFLQIEREVTGLYEYSMFNMAKK